MGLFDLCFPANKRARRKRAAREKMRSKYHSKKHQAFDESEICFKCQVKFSSFNRRHHCRRCHHSFCNKHSDFKVPVSEEDGAERVRVCERCMQATINMGMSWGSSLKIGLLDR